MQGVAPVRQNVAGTPHSCQHDSHTDLPTGTEKDVMTEITNGCPEPNKAAVTDGSAKLNRKKRKSACKAGVAASIATFTREFARIETAKIEMYKSLELRKLELQHQLAERILLTKRARIDSVTKNPE
ncbi:hypothetical protein R1flu_022348 [Riccia fluitans]|uniref:Uncharacterized protein n=1 Tax=Riccia fluitans TaxID=41844 RepID=A0ABD1ZS88_9MARC